MPAYATVQYYAGLRLVSGTVRDSTRRYANRTKGCIVHIVPNGRYALTRTSSTVCGAAQLQDLWRASVSALLQFEAVRCVEYCPLPPKTGRKEKLKKAKQKEQKCYPNTTSFTT